MLTDSKPCLPAAQPHRFASKSNTHTHTDRHHQGLACVHCMYLHGPADISALRVTRLRRYFAGLGQDVCCPCCWPSHQQTVGPASCHSAACTLLHHTQQHTHSLLIVFCTQHVHTHMRTRTHPYPLSPTRHLHTRHGFCNQLALHSKQSMQGGSLAAGSCTAKQGVRHPP